MPPTNFFMAKTKTTKTSKTAKPKAKAKAAVSKVSRAEKASVNAPNGGKIQIIEKFATKQGDTGSPEVQAALLSERVEKLVTHLKGNPSDDHSRRGLLGIVSKRRRLLNYLKSKDNERYKDLVVKLKLTK